MKDILIGAADLYNYEHIRPWVKSARQSGFEGDIYLICYRVDENIYQAENDGVEFYNVEHTPYSTPIVHAQQGSPTQAHNFRFYHAWELLTRLQQDNVHYNHVIMTDARDVIFQKNPSNWLDAYEIGTHKKIVAPSEHIRFEAEPWNKDNLIKGYGSIFYETVGKNWQACNVGTIAGAAKEMCSLFHTIFSMTEGRYYPSDQSSFNVLVHNNDDTKFWIARSNDGWAAQLGTTQDPTKEYLWSQCNEHRPTIHADGSVRTIDGNLFTIVHQWDRVPQLKALIPERYK